MNDKYSAALKAVIAGSVFLVGYLTSDILKFAGLRRVLGSAEFNLLVNFLQIAFCTGAIIFVYRTGLKGALSELGLWRSPFKRAIVFSLIATLPMLIGFAATSNLAAGLSLVNILAFTVISPLAEEVLFRGYIFRQLYRRVKTGFWPAVLLPSLLFALGHLYQSKGVWDFVAITLITGLGGVLFSWVFMRWKDNLWVPFGLHFLMNFWWEIFAVDDTALGGWVANIARFLTVAAAIFLTLYKDRFWKPLPVEEENIAEIKAPADQTGKISFSAGEMIFGEK
ncbi:MAG: CPBP family intramembrane glutamic endopeptidase [Pyrinomonadaceae bacterium]